MTANNTTDITAELLKNIRDEMREGFSAVGKRFDQVGSQFTAVGTRLDRIEYNISILADGLIIMRRDVQTLTIASAGHGERMAAMELKLEKMDLARS